MTIANEIADAHGPALEPIQAAGIIFRNLFETGPSRLSSMDKAVAIGTITAGLQVWKKQLLTGHDAEVAKWKDAYRDAKNEMENVKLRLAIALKEK